MSLQPWLIVSMAFILLSRPWSQPLRWWQPAWSHRYDGNDVELYLLRVWPELIKFSPQTWFSFPLLERRCLRNVMISVIFSLLEVEDYHIIWFFLSIITVSRCAFSRSCGPKHYPCGKENPPDTWSWGCSKARGLSAETILFKGWAQSGEVSWCAVAMSWHLVGQMLHSLPLS